MKYKVTFKSYGSVVSSYTLPTEYEAISAAKSIAAKAMGYRSSEIVTEKESDTIRLFDNNGKKVRGITIKVVG